MSHDESAAVANKTILKRIEQYKDRWTSYGTNTGIEDLSDRLTPSRLKQFELFAEYSDRFLERISQDVSVAKWKKDAVLFEEGAYIDIAFFVVSGTVEVSALPGSQNTGNALPIFQQTLHGIDIGNQDLETEAKQTQAIRKTMIGSVDPKNITFLSAMDFDLPAGSAAQLGPGEFFGEIGALSGWPQSVSAKIVEPATLIQIRLPALRLMKHKSSILKNRLDEIYKDRALFSQLRQTPLFRPCEDNVIASLCRQVDLVSIEPGGVVCAEGDSHDAIYLIRSGFLKMSRRVGKGDLVTSYLSKGMTLGEVELLVNGLNAWETTATAVGYVELVKIGLSALRELLGEFPMMEEQLWQSATAKIKAAGYGQRNLDHSEFTRVALETGLIQGNSALVIDLERCTRCDDCVRGCAVTHNGRPRFIREGHKYANLEIPKSCYHCRDPICLVGCPTGAIHRGGTGDLVSIDEDICIGCSTCANNCPYDAIVMHQTGETWPDDMIPIGLRGTPRQVASKCDLCMDTGHDPACVRNCPQGCASRIGSVEQFEALLKPSRGDEKPRLSRRSATGLLLFLLSAVACLGLYGINSAMGDTRPGSPWIRGYGIAAALFLALSASLGLRRRMMRFVTRWKLGRASTWLRLHIYGSALFMLLVLMHSGFKIPSGWLSFSLLGLSLWTTLSGLAGLLLQRWIPRMLAGSVSVEVIYDRIPELVDDLRARAEKLVANASEPVRAFYAKSVAPDLQGPRSRLAFFFGIGAGILPRLKGFKYPRSFLDEDEGKIMDRIKKLYKTKLELDAHYTLQKPLRVWLYFHVPPAVLLVALVVFHIVTVTYY